MLVQTPNRRVSEKNAAAAVRLQSVLVRIDDDRIDVRQSCIRLLVSAFRLLASPK